MAASSINYGCSQNQTTPNGEDCESVMAFYDIIRGTYGKEGPVLLSDYVRLWNAVGFDEKRIQKIVTQVERILADQQLVGRLTGVFDQMVGNWDNTRGGSLFSTNGT